MVSHSSRRVCGSRPAEGSSEEHFGIVHHGAGDGEPLHHAARKGADHVVGAVGELEGIEQLVGAAFALAGALAEIRAVEQEHFARREGEIQIGPLRHHADQPLGLHLLLPDVEFADEGAAGGGFGAGGEDADGSRFAGAVRAQEAEDFTGADLEGDAIQGHQLELLLGFVPARRALPGEGEAGSARRTGRWRAVDLAQVFDADADGHPIPPRFQSSSSSCSARSIMPRTRLVSPRPAACRLARIRAASGP